ncbi:AI-2E family transporter [Euryarchaeota archaeon]|nr:AI-2E family transporter [Euryarchaeota archaeon]|tara:strand:+ start:11441 stop:12868 length:1428 start_codon:yes stop_codon:yes gene_type:complete
MEHANTAWDSGRFNRRVSTFAHVLIIVTLAVVWLILLKGVLQPFFIALGIYFVLKPGSDYLSTNGFPVILSYLTMVMLTLLVVSSATLFAYHQAAEVIEDEDKMEDYNNLLEERWYDLKSTPLISTAFEDEQAMNNTLVEDLASWGVLENDQQLSDAAVGMLSGVGSLLATSVTVMFFLIFIIFEASLLPGRIERAWPGGASDRVQIVRSKIEASVNTYIVVKTGVGFGTALCAGLVMLFFGIDLWFTWALLTFLLNYVPYIGSLIATLPPIVLGLILLEPASLTLLILLLLTNQQLWGQIIETRWAGRALDLSPVVLLLVTAISFAGWGILGMILAVPFAVIVKIVLENIEATRPISILLSERAPSIDEAWEEAMKDGRLSSFETQSLTQLQEVLGYSNREIKLISGRIAVGRVLRRGKITDDQLDLINDVADALRNHEELSAEVSSTLHQGKVDKEMRPVLTRLLAAIEEEEE